MVRAALSPQVIIRAAAESADADGPESISMAGLARRFGVQTASLYSHVRDRAEVLDAVHTLAMAELAERIAAATTGWSGRDAVRGLATAEREYATEHPGRWAVLGRTGSQAVRSSEAARQLVHYTFAVFRGYGLDEVDVVHATRLLGSTVNGFIALQRSGAFDNREPDPDVSWDRMLEALDGVFASWAHPRSAQATSTTEDH